MNCYRIFKSLVRSNHHPICLKPLPEGVGEYEFRHYAGGSLTSLPDGWLSQWESDGCVWALLGKLGGEFLIRFPEYADFLISADRRLIRCYSQPEISSETISHLFLDQVFPCLLGGQNSIVLHAGAVIFSTGAIVFIGESGSGKSTLSASLSAAGFPLLTDDSLLLRECDGEFQCVPSYQGVRLWPESVSGLFGAEVYGTPMAQYSAKQRLFGEKGELVFADRSVPLRNIYLLSPLDEKADSVSILPMNLRDAYLELLTHTYRLDVTDRNRIKEECDLVARLIEAVNPRRLSFPREFDFLPKVRQALLSD